VTKIVEIWNKALHVYHGNYERYLEQKQERRAQLESAYRNQREHIEHLETFINRFRYQATKAKQVQKPHQELEKIERIDCRRKSRSSTSPSRSRLPPAALWSKSATSPELRSQEGARWRELHHRPRRSHRAGRHQWRRKIHAHTNALRKRRPSSGTLKLGHNVTAEYFAQDQYKVLNPNARMLDDISSIAPRIPQADLRGLLAAFSSPATDAFKSLGVLSRR